jgi:hypothetical protein
MAALPWAQAQTIDPNREYVAMASRLPLKAYRFVPGFLRDTLRIRCQLLEHRASSVTPSTRNSGARRSGPSPSGSTRLACTNSPLPTRIAASPNGSDRR